VLVSDFDFDLPDELVAQEPRPRGRSRMLVLDRATGALEHSTIAALPSHLRAGDLLVLNDTRVFSARLIGRRVPSGGAVECLLLGRERTGGAEDEAVYSALMHPGQKLKEGARVRFEGEAGAILGEVLGRHFHGRRTIRLRSESGGPLDPLVDAIGHIPLPPYIRRADTPADRERYQTVFARARGSVAAPTAGLHFTQEVLDDLRRMGVDSSRITLHVGYGTFKPVRTDVVEQHTVDPEWYEITPAAAEALESARAAGRRIVAVGTTTTRAIEDAAIRGHGRIVPGDALASVFIYPGFQFQVIGGLLTNFHLPRSSLLMLVCAFAGRERVLAAYSEAVKQGYHFYSYGDAMLVL
jgi:S-adenosylmethionine:tRNA ribosyltransferase-isomerase